MTKSIEKTDNINNNETFIDLTIYVKQNWNYILDIFTWKNNYSLFIFSILFVNFL